MSVLSTFSANRELFYLLVRRQIQQQFKGSILGVGWVLVTPFAMLAVFSLVFGSVIPVRWATESDSQNVEGAYFVINLFCGLAPYFYFSELMNTSTAAIVNRPNYVKKIVFPLELIPLVDVCASTVNLAIFTTLLILAASIFADGPTFQMLLIPLLLLPFVVLLAGVAMIFSSLAVYFRDLRQIVSPLVLMMMFLSPVFYPLSTLPDWLAQWMVLNPLAFVIEGLRNILFGTGNMDLVIWLGYVVTAVLVFLLGLKWFLSIRRGFADLL